jgi:hypothetical protein
MLYIEIAKDLVLLFVMYQFEIEESSMVVGQWDSP